MLKEEADGEADGWRLAKTTDVGEVWKKSESDTPIQVVKVIHLEIRAIDAVWDSFVGVFEVSWDTLG